MHNSYIMLHNVTQCYMFLCIFWHFHSFFFFRVVCGPLHGPCVDIEEWTAWSRLQYFVWNAMRTSTSAYIRRDSAIISSWDEGEVAQNVSDGHYVQNWFWHFRKVDQLGLKMRWCILPPLLWLRMGRNFQVKHSGNHCTLDFHNVTHVSADMHFEEQFNSAEPWSIKIT